MTLRDALAAELAAARQRRDSAATTALRSTLSALANAEAVPHDASAGVSAGSDAVPQAVTSPHFPGARAGLGSAEAPRRALSPEEVRAIVVRERDDLLSHAQRLSRLCRRDEADGARRAADTLTRIVAQAGGPPGA